MLKKNRAFKLKAFIFFFICLNRFFLKFYYSFFQVNISNTWTLPQEGFSVFYRFFRDKISWFEADAVCQFHHGNLVTGKSIFAHKICIYKYHIEIDVGYAVMNI